MRSLYFLALASLLTACTGYQYVASPQYVPLNTKKGVLKANGSYAFAQAGYTITNHISVFGTWYKRSGGTDINFENWGSKEGSGANTYKDHSYEINFGTSYFTSLSTHLIFEVQAGTGFGKAYYNHVKDYGASFPYTIEMTDNKTNLFVQPSIGLRFPKLDDHFQFGAFVKIINDHYKNTGMYTTVLHPEDKEDRYFINRPTRNLKFAEPGVCVKGGSKWVKGCATVCLPLNLEGDQIRHRPLNIYLSAFLSFDLLKKKTNR
jgi:hypothetical protein